MLDKPLEAAIIMMVIITTFIAPPLLQLVLDEPEGSDGLEDALASEETVLAASD